MKLRTAASALVMAWATLSAADAASLSVAPLGVVLDKAGSSATLTVSNAGDTSVELSAAAFRWTQSAGQSQVLAPTNDVVVYPHQFTLAELAQHVVRVGLVGKTDAPETAYRIVITELPKADATTADALQMRTRVSIPLFVQTAKNGTHTLALNAASASKSQLKFSINSTGTEHSLIRDAAVDLRDAKGAIIATEHVSGWYLLPGSEQTYAAEMPKDACDKVAKVVIHVTQETGPVIDLAGTPERACAAH